MSASIPFLHVFAVQLLLYFVATLCSAKAIGIRPGNYHESGRVIRYASGEYGVLWGRGAVRFPANEQQKLEPYLGQFVGVDYQRVASDHPFTGSTIGRIEKINVLARSTTDLPVTVSVKPAKLAFRIGEPIEATVTISSNQAAESWLHLGSSSTVLFQDYAYKLILEPDNHYSDQSSYKCTEGPIPGKIQHGQRIEFSIKSAQMAEPGVYDLVYVLSNGPREVGSQSEPQRIEVLPADEKERHEALWSWLKTAAPSQRIKIADTLAGEGDADAVDEFLAQLKAGVFSANGCCYDAAYRLAFHYGGEAGARIMVDMVKGQLGQDRAGRMMEGIHMAKNRVPLLLELLACDHPTMRAISGWVDKPRICDISAGWLMGYTEGRMKFPENGSLEARDAAVAAVRSALEKNPATFHVLTSEYR